MRRSGRASRITEFSYEHRGHGRLECSLDWAGPTHSTWNGVSLLRKSLLLWEMCSHRMAAALQREAWSVNKQLQHHWGAC